MSAKAVQLLIARIKGKSDIPGHVIIQCELELRGSTGST